MLGFGCGADGGAAVGCGRGEWVYVGRGCGGDDDGVGVRARMWGRRRWDVGVGARGVGLRRAQRHGGRRWRTWGV